MISKRSVLTGLGFGLVGCSPGASARTLKVAATATPHAEILEFVRPGLERQGVHLAVSVFNDYVQPNLQVEARRLDANYFQNRPYLDQFNRDHGSHLVPVIGVHIEPLGGYSRRYKDLSSLPKGATVAIPNEATNEGRALLLLQRAGLITLARADDPLSTLRDVTNNPRDLKFKELEGALLPRVLDQVDLAVINTNYALDAKLNPTKDAIVLEDSRSPYVNVLVARPDNRDSADLRALAAALTSSEVKTYIASRYGGAVVAAF